MRKLSVYWEGKQRKNTVMKKKIISEGKSKVQEEIVSLESYKHNVNANKNQPYNIIIR